MSLPGAGDGQQLLASARDGARSGRVEFRIDKHGVWHYRGSPITREPMVRLFAGLLRVERGRHILLTPDQRIPVDVEDAPFVVIASECEGSGADRCIRMSTNVGESFLLSAEHPLLMRASEAGTAALPYLLTRDGLLAIVHRNVFYRLVDLLEPDAEGTLRLRSAREWFALG